MSHFANHARPWIPDYAFPDYSLEEPLPRGRVRVSPGRKRGSGEMPRGRDWGNPRPWASGYEIPEYVYDEPDGAAYATRGRRRGAGLERPSPLDGDGQGEPDPFLQFGENTATYIMRSLRKVPREWRQVALKAFMDQLDPTLWGRTRENARQLRSEGAGRDEALRAGFAEALASGVAKELFDAGERGQVAPSGILSLGAYPDAEERVALGVWGEIKDMLKSTYKTPIETAKRIGSGTKRAARKTWNWSKDAASKVKNGTCWLVNRKHAALVGSLAGGVGSQMIGVPAPAGAAAGGMGVQALQKVCPSDVEGLPPELLEKLMAGAQQPQREIPWGPIAAGVGVFALVLVAAR